jgi:NADH:ubiquinone oxidoreductase subunit D
MLVDSNFRSRMVGVGVTVQSVTKTIEVVVGASLQATGVSYTRL